MSLCQLFNLPVCARSVALVSGSLYGMGPARLLCPWDSPGKNTGVSCHFLLQGIFPTPGTNTGLPHCRQILCHLSHWLSRWLKASGSVVKESACRCRKQRRHWFDPWVGKIPWRRKWLLTLVFLAGESYGQRSLAGYSPWGCKESDVTE